MKASRDPAGPWQRLRRIAESCLRRGWWLLLFVPSGWFWASIPPLWRDSDGFHQVHAEIGGLTLLLWPPLYCLLARIPLALGAWWEGVPFSFDAPALTDAGVGLLIAGQHLLLIAAVAWFISIVARREGTRLILSAAFAGVPTFYAFAHAVGSESLSSTMQFAVMAMGALLLKQERPCWRAWLGYAGLLAVAVLTRHINAVFAALLPVAFLLRAGVEIGRGAARNRSPGMGPIFRKFGFAVLAGVIAIVSANLAVRTLCAVSGTPYHSKFGFVFQWRTAFVAGKSASLRAKFFHAVCGRLSDPLAISALRAYEAALQAGAHPPPEFLSDFVKEALKKDGSLKRRSRLVMAAKILNGIAFTILTTAPPGYAGAVGEDFWKSFSVSVGAITREPAASTQFFVAALPQPDFEPLRRLVTFRNGYYRSAVSDFAAHAWLTIGTRISLAALTVIAIGLWLCGWAISPGETWRNIYPPALLGIGWLLIFLNCGMTFSMPRFDLPLLETTLAAASIALAGMLDRVGGRGNAREPLR